MADLAQRIARNLADVRARIADAAATSGRPADEITLVAITKYVGEAEVRALVEAGAQLLDFEFDLTGVETWPARNSA